MREMIKRFCLTAVMAVVGILPAVTLADDYVAEIDGGISYPTLKSALQNVASGGKVRLLDNVTISAAADVATIKNKGIELDLNGKTISGKSPLVKMGTNGKLTIIDETGADPEVSATGGAAIAITDIGASVEIEAGTYSGTVVGITSSAIEEALGANDNTDVEADILVKGGVFTLASGTDLVTSSPYVDEDDVTFPADPDGIQVTITGGTFSANPAQYGYIPTDAIDGYYATTQVSGGYQVLPAVATDGTSYYANLTDAVNGTAANGTITLIADDTVSFANGGVAIDKNLTIDGAEYTITGVSDVGSGNVASPSEINDSTVHGFYIKGGDVTIKNVTLTQFGDTDYVNKFGRVPVLTSTSYTGNLTLQNVNIDKFNRQAICTFGGTLTVTGGTINGNATNKGAGSDQFQQPIEVRGGTATIDGVMITGGNSNLSYSGGAIVAFPGSTATINNANINFTGIGVWSDTATVTVTGSGTTITATDKAVFVEEAGIANIEDGTYNGVLGVDTDTSKIAVSGGTFSVAVPEDYCALGYLPQDNGDGTYGVQRGAIVEFSVLGEITTEVVEKGSSISSLAPATPDKPTETYYYVFAYWSADNGATKYQTNELPAPTADIKYFAYFTKYYTMYERDGNYYKSFSDAIVGAEDGATLKLMHSGSTQIYANGSNIDVTIDLNDKTITRTDTYMPVVVTGGAKVTLTNGSIVYNYQQTASGAYPAIIALGGSTLVLGEDLEIINEYSHTTEGNDYYGYGVMVYDDAKVTLAGATITADYGVSVFGDNDETTGDATFEMISGEIESSVFGVANNGNLSNSGTLIQIKGGTITCDEVGIYHPGSGTLEISGGEISGGTAVYVKSGSVSVTDGTFTANADADEYAYYGNGVKPVTGDAFVIDNCGYPGGTPAASITGGTFISENAEPIASYASGTDSITGEDREPIGSFVSGGSFSSPVPDEYTSDGKASTLVLNNDNLYVVVNAKTITWDVDGAQTTDKIAVGEMPSYEGTPTKDPEGNTSYVFIGWTPELAVVTDDATYTAQFGYRIALQKDDGTILQEKYIPIASGSEPIIVSEAELELYVNNSCTVQVVGAPEGAGFNFTTSGKVGYDSYLVTPAGWSKTEGWAKPFGKTSGNGENKVKFTVTLGSDEIATLEACVVVKDVIAVVDGVEYAAADYANAVNAAINGDKVLEAYYGKSTPIVTLEEGQSLRWKPADNRGKGSVWDSLFSVPDSTDEAWYQVVKTKDDATGITTVTIENQGVPLAKVTSTDDTVTYWTSAFNTGNLKNGDICQLLKDYTDDSNVVFSSSKEMNVTLDLNGKTLTVKNLSVNGSTYTKKLVSLTIDDTSESGSGKIVSTASTSGTAAIWPKDEYSTVTIKAGTIESAQDYWVYAGGGSRVTIEGGTFNSNTDTVAGLNCQDNNGTITVSGGSFKGFNPANNTNEGPNTDYVAEGYVSVADDPESGWYTVYEAVTVTFVNEKGDAPEAQTIGKGKTATKPDDPTVVNGYTFDGWFAPDTEGEFDFETPITANLTLTAGWTPISYNITYVLNGGEFETDADQPETYTVENYPTLVSPTKTGYTFADWLLDDEEEDTITAIPEGTLGNITLTATWTPAKVNYTVEHYQADLNADTYTIVDSDTETKEGYTESDTEAVAKTYEGFTEKTFDQAEILADGSTVVTIYYDRNTYTVTWVNDGTTIETDTAVQFGDTPSYDGATPTRATDPATGTAYVFSGWDPAITSDTLVNAEVTYTAQFNSIAKKARIDTNEGSTFYDSISEALVDASDDTKIYVYNFTASELPDGWLYNAEGGYLFRAAASATIGNTTEDFATIQDAFDAVDLDGTVTLLKNTTEYPLYATTACTLDLNGFALTGVIEPDFDFTVVDTYVDPETEATNLGTIQLPTLADGETIDGDTLVDGAIWAWDGATVTISGGTYANPAVVLWTEGANVVINGGVFETYAVVPDAENCAAATRKNRWDVDAVITVTDGEFNGSYIIGTHQYAKGATLNIEGGWFKAADAWSQQTIDNEGVSVSGGYFTQEPVYLAEGYVAAANTDEDTNDVYPFTVDAVLRTATITSIVVHDLTQSANITVALNNWKSGTLVKLWAKIDYNDAYWAQVDEKTAYVNEEVNEVTFFNVPVSYNTVYTATGEDTISGSFDSGANVVGTLAVDVAGGTLSLLGVPYTSFNSAITTTITLGELFQTDTLEEGDWLYVLGLGGYSATAYYNWDGENWLNGSEIADNVALASGTVVAIYRTTSGMVRINGEVKGTTTAIWADAAVMSDTLTVGMNVIANSNPVATNLQGITPINAGDTITYTDGNGTTYNIRWDGSRWYHNIVERRNWERVETQADAPVIPAGAAFIYNRVQ